MVSDSPSFHQLRECMGTGMGGTGQRHPSGRPVRCNRGWEDARPARLTGNKRPTRSRDCAARSGASRQPSASALLHPLPVAALLLLVLNDHAFKAAYPSWVTGKLSDLAGLALFPFFLQAAYEFACAIGRQRPLPRRTSLIAASVITGVAFVCVEVTPWGEGFYRQALGLLQWIPGGVWAVALGQALPAPQPVLATSDPTDLVALAVLPLLTTGAVWRLPRRLRLLHLPSSPFGHFVAVVALTAASVAIVATSPPPEPESLVGGKYAEEIELTAEQPVAIRQLAVRLNREALMFETRPTAIARLSLVPIPDDSEGAQDFEPMTSVGDAVTIQVIPDTADDPPMVSAGTSAEGLRFFEYNPAWGVETCQEAEPCERTYQVLLELRDAASEPLRFRLAAEGQIQYAQEDPPSGASIAIEPVGELEFRGPVPAVRARVEGVVDPTRFENAEVHLRITRSAEAGAAEPLAEALLTSVSLDVRPKGASPRVNVFFGHENRVGAQDGASDRYQLGAEDLPQAVIVTPFRSCQSDAICTVEYNVRFALCCSADEDAATVAWRFDVALRYPHATELPPGASVEIEQVRDAQFQNELVERCISVGREIIVTAQKSWSLSFVEAETQRAKLDRGEWLPEMVHPDWRIICDLVLAGRLDPTQPVPSQP